MRPAWGEYLQRAGVAAGADGAGGLLLPVKRRSLLAALERLGRALPTGLFSDAAHGAPAAHACSPRPAAATTSASCSASWCWWPPIWTAARPCPSASPGCDDVPISLAVQASAALPGLFPPVAITGRTYVDGALKKTLHATVLLDEGLDLLICLNPLVPFDATHATRHTRAGQRRAAHPAAGRRRPAGGAVADLPLADPFAAGARHEGLRPQPSAAPTSCCSSPTTRDPEMFLANTFSYRSAARWPSTPTSARARCCARGAPRSARNWRATA